MLSRNSLATETSAPPGGLHKPGFSSEAADDLSRSEDLRSETQGRILASGSQDVPRMGLSAEGAGRMDAKPGPVQRTPRRQMHSHFQSASGIVCWHLARLVRICLRAGRGGARGQVEECGVASSFYCFVLKIRRVR